MDKKITELVYNYTIDGRMADAEYVNKIVSIVSDEYGLKDFIKKPITVFLDDTKRVIGSSYHYNHEKLTIDLNAELKKYRHVSIKNKILLFNLNVLLIILHELDHVHLKKEVENGEEDLTAHFFKLTNPDVSEEELKQRHDMYMKYYNLAPFERHANINAHLILNDVMTGLASTSLAGQSLEQIRLINLKQFIKICRSGYRIYNHYTNSPSFDYIQCFASKKDMMRLAVYDDNLKSAYQKAASFYDLKNRILYGLPLTKEELKYINKKGNPFHVYELLKPDVKPGIYHYEGINNNTYNMLFKDFYDIDETEKQKLDYYFVYYVMNFYTTHSHDRTIRRLLHLKYSKKNEVLNYVNYDKKNKLFFIMVDNERFDFDLLSKHISSFKAKKELNNMKKRGGKCHTRSIGAATIIKDSAIMTGYMTVDDMKVLHSIILKKNDDGTILALDWNQNIIMSYDQYKKLFNFQEIKEIPGSYVLPDLKKTYGLSIDSKAYLTFRDEIMKDLSKNEAVLGLKNK